MTFKIRNLSLQKKLQITETKMKRRKRKRKRKKMTLRKLSQILQMMMRSLKILPLKKLRRNLLQP